MNPLLLDGLCLLFASQKELGQSHALPGEMLIGGPLKEFIQLSRPQGRRAGNSALTHSGRHAEIWPNYGFQSNRKGSVCQKDVSSFLLHRWVQVTDKVGSSLCGVPGGLSPGPLA